MYKFGFAIFLAVFSGSALADDALGSQAESRFGVIPAFLKTLTGEIPEITYPELPVSSASTPKPETMVRPRSATN